MGTPFHLLTMCKLVRKFSKAGEISDIKTSPHAGKFFDRVSLTNNHLKRFLSKQLKVLERNGREANELRNFKYFLADEGIVTK